MDLHQIELVKVEILVSRSDFPFADALVNVSHGGVSRRRRLKAQNYRAVSGRHLMPLVFSPLNAEGLSWI